VDLLLKDPVGVRGLDRGVGDNSPWLRADGLTLAPWSAAASCSNLERRLFTAGSGVLSMPEPGSSAAGIVSDPSVWG
jgi:hypothetical protein